MSRKEHWENVYTTKTDNEVSWTQTDPRTSFTLITEVARHGKVIDVGGGTSVLTDRLLDAGFAVTVLDISQAALNRARQRLGARASQVRWIAADVTAIGDLGAFDVWHDRAVFHFLTYLPRPSREPDLSSGWAVHTVRRCDGNALPPGARRLLPT